MISQIRVVIGAVLDKRSLQSAKFPAGGTQFLCHVVPGQQVRVQLKQTVCRPPQQVVVRREILKDMGAFVRQDTGDRDTAVVVLLDKLADELKAN
jgi:hypothetical protein